MTSTSTSTLPADSPHFQLFYYRNASSQMQILRVERTSPERLEKVMFPGEQLLFWASPTDCLEIHTHQVSGLALIEQVSCAQLSVVQGKEPGEGL